MPKGNFRPSKGKTIEKVLEEAKDAVVELGQHIEDSQWDRYEQLVNEWKEKIIAIVNPGTCLTEEQDDYLSWLFINMFYPADRDLSSTDDFRCVIDKNGLDDPTTPNEVASERINRIVLLANSFRLECANCLNTECEDRDSNFPINE